MVANFDRNQSFGSNPGIQSVIDWLLSQHLPPLPVAPRQNPREYHKVVKTDLSKQSWEHCPLDPALQPIPIFTGKSPSFLDQRSVPHLINHSQYQSRLPSGSDLRKWFANPDNGIGSLGGIGGIIWIDFDIKQFSSESECSKAVIAWLESHPELKDTFCERTHSGGWRIGVKARQKPDFTNFALTPGGEHIGEALGKGRFTVLAPTIGPSGNRYQSVNCTFPVEIESLESIGIFPSGKPKPEPGHPIKPNSVIIPGSIPLDMLLTEQARAILNGDNPTGDRSESLTTLIREAYGWENWAKDNNVLIRDNAEILTHAAGAALGIDPQRVERILKTINSTDCHPAAAHKGGETSCWLKIRRLDKETFNAKCPQFVKDAIAQESQSRNFSNQLSSSGSIPAGSDKNNGAEVFPNFPENNVVHLPVARQQLRLSTEQLTARLRELIDQGASQAFIEGVIPELAEQSGRKDSAVHRLLGALELESEQRQSLSDNSDQFKKLINHQAKKLDVHRIFPEALAKSLESKASSDRIDPVRLVQNLLPAVGGILGSKIGILAKEGETQDDSWIEYPIFWTVDVGPPSSGKSNANSAIFAPLKDLQAEEAKRYKEACEELKKIEKTWESKTAEEQEQLKDTQSNPDVFKIEVIGVKRKLLFDIAEIEAILRRLSEQSSTAGAVWDKDELQGLFSGLDQYKSGSKGNARQTLLSAWNGRIRIDIDRVKEEDSYALSGQTLNICGGMQPGVAREFYKSKGKNGEPDPDGLQSRILAAVSSMPPDFAVWSDVKVSINEVLTGIYAELDRISSGLIICFDNEAQGVWKRQWEKFKQGYLHYLDSNPAFAYFLGKMPSHLPRLVLALHCLEHCFVPKADFNKVGLDTLKRAIELAEFYVSQFRLLQAMTQEGEAQLEGVMLRLWNKATEKGKLSIRDAQQSFRSLKLKAPALKEIFQAIAQRGYGYLEDEGKTLVAQKNVDLVDPLLSVDQQAKSTTKAQEQVISVDLVDHLLIHEQHTKTLTSSALQTNVDHVDQKNPTSSNFVGSTPLEVEHDCHDPWDSVSPCKGDQHDQQIAETIAKQQVQIVDPRSTNDQHDQQKIEQPGAAVAESAEAIVAQPSHQQKAPAPVTESPEVTVPPAPPIAIRVRQRVKVHCEGSQRDGKTGVVKSVDGTKAVVLLEDTTIRQALRRWECCVSWLEVLHE